jgi:hypothetical protein
MILVSCPIRILAFLKIWYFIINTYVTVSSEFRSLLTLLRPSNDALIMKDSPTALIGLF